MKQMILQKWLVGVAGHGMSPASRLQKYWLIGLGLLLAGYAFFDKGFAYLGVAPLFVGEVTLALGLLAAAVGGGMRQALRSPLSWLLIAFALLGAVRTIPYLGTYGLDALRDAVVWGYGAFALLVCAFLLRSGWLSSVPERYGRLLPWFLGWLPVAILIMSLAGDLIPRWPGTDVPLLYLKSGDTAVHLAGGASFLLLGLYERSVRQDRLWLKEWVWWTLWAISAFAVASASRSGLLAILAALFVVLLLRPLSIKRFVKVAFIGMILIMPFLLFNTQLDLTDEVDEPDSPQSVYGRRAVSPQQLFDNLATVIGDTEGAADDRRVIELQESLEDIYDNLTSSSAGSAGEVDVSNTGEVDAGSAGEGNLADNGENTPRYDELGLGGPRQWRLEWWNKIVDYTFFGEYFWAGKGFGINLAQDDGFLGEWFPDMRAPHNGHMTILARAGVPGLVLWTLLQGVFGISLLLAYLRAHRNGQEWWARVDLWILAYWVAFIVNMSFDVYLEGPQGGIWFWSLFGFGMAILVAQRRGLTGGATREPNQKNH